jgi:hypothetical protein
VKILRRQGEKREERYVAVEEECTLEWTKGDD